MKKFRLLFSLTFTIFGFMVSADSHLNNNPELYYCDITPDDKILENAIGKVCSEGGNCDGLDLADELSMVGSNCSDVALGIGEGFLERCVIEKNASLSNVYNEFCQVKSDSDPDCQMNNVREAIGSKLTCEYFDPSQSVQFRRTILQDNEQVERSIVERFVFLRRDKDGAVTEIEGDIYFEGRFRPDIFDGIERPLVWTTIVAQYDLGPTIRGFPWRSDLGFIGIKPTVINQDFLIDGRSEDLPTLGVLVLRESGLIQAELRKQVGRDFRIEDSSRALSVELDASFSIVGGITKSPPNQFNQSSFVAVGGTGQDNLVISFLQAPVVGGPRLIGIYWGPQSELTTKIRGYDTNFGRVRQCDRENEVLLHNPPNGTIVGISPAGSGDYLTRTLSRTVSEAEFDRLSECE